MSPFRVESEFEPREVQKTVADVRERFPQLTVIDGPKRASDDEGQPYFTYSLGGIKNENRGMPSMVNMSDEALFEFFWERIAKLTLKSTTIVVRQPPTLRTITEWVVEDGFDLGRPSLVPQERKTVTGRFSVR